MVESAALLVDKVLSPTTDVPVCAEHTLPATVTVYTTAGDHGTDIRYRLPGYREIYDPNQKVILD